MSQVGTEVKSHSILTQSSLSTFIFRPSELDLMPKARERGHVTWDSGIPNYMTMHRCSSCKTQKRIHKCYLKEIYTFLRGAANLPNEMFFVLLFFLSKICTIFQNVLVLFACLFVCFGQFEFIF